jgi:FMN phosphatase YigB (HAD superfamily)
MSVKAVIFDLFKTLVDIQYSEDDPAIYDFMSTPDWHVDEDRRNELAPLLVSML